MMYLIKQAEKSPLKDLYMPIHTLTSSVPTEKNNVSNLKGCNVNDC